MEKHISMILPIEKPLKSSHGHFNDIFLGKILTILPLVSGHKLFCQRHVMQIQQSFKVNLRGVMHINY